MVCKKCGKPLPNEGAVCKFCGMLMDQNQIRTMKNMSDPQSSFQAKLLSDRYGIDKSSIYEKKDDVKENKLLGAFVIIVVLVFLIILAILMNVGK